MRHLTDAFFSHYSYLLLARYTLRVGTRASRHQRPKEEFNREAEIQK